MMFEAEYKALAQLHYEKTLKKLREQEALASATKEIVTQPSEIIGPIDRAELRDAYLKTFTKIVILDICWAASQHYSEWKRWLRGADVMKNGSTPDLAFRAILTSGKPPWEYRKQPRPKGWK